MISETVIGGIVAGFAVLVAVGLLFFYQRHIVAPMKPYLYPLGFVQLRQQHLNTIEKKIGEGSDNAAIHHELEQFSTTLTRDKNNADVSTTHDIFQAAIQEVTVYTPQYFSRIIDAFTAEKETTILMHIIHSLGKETNYFTPTRWLPPKLLEKLSQAHTLQEVKLLVSQTPYASYLEHATTNEDAIFFLEKYRKDTIEKAMELSTNRLFKPLQPLITALADYHTIDVITRFTGAQRQELLVPYGMISIVPDDITTATTALFDKTPYTIEEDSMLPIGFSEALQHYINRTLQTISREQAFSPSSLATYILHLLHVEEQVNEQAFSPSQRLKVKT